MKAMRRDSAEAADMIRSAKASAHVMSRLLAASEECVRNVLLDPALRTTWAMSDTLTQSVPTVILEQGDVMLKEFVQGHAISIRIQLFKRMSVCEVHVELRMSPAFDQATLFGLGIDDIWEARLYAIADLAMRTPPNAKQPLFPWINSYEHVYPNKP